MEALDTISQRTDPYRNLKFHVKWDYDSVAGASRVVAGASKLLGLDRGSSMKPDPGSVSTSSARAAADPKRLNAITLDHGVVFDQAFDHWAYACMAALEGPRQGGDTSELRRDLRIDLNNEVGDPVETFLFRQCLATEYAAMPDLDGSAHEYPFEHMKLEHRGWSPEGAEISAEQQMRRRWWPFRWR